MVRYIWNVLDFAVGRRTPPPLTSCSITPPFQTVLLRTSVVQPRCKVKQKSHGSRIHKGYFILAFAPTKAGEGDKGQERITQRRGGRRVSRRARRFAEARWQIVTSSGGA